MVHCDADNLYMSYNMYNGVNSMNYKQEATGQQFCCISHKNTILHKDPYKRAGYDGPEILCCPPYFIFKITQDNNINSNLDVKILLFCCQFGHRFYKILDFKCSNCKPTNLKKLRYIKY